MHSLAFQEVLSSSFIIRSSILFQRERGKEKSFLMMRFFDGWWLQSLLLVLTGNWSSRCVTIDWRRCLCEVVACTQRVRVYCWHASNQDPFTAQQKERRRGSKDRRTRTLPYLGNICCIKHILVLCCKREQNNTINNPYIFLSTHTVKIKIILLRSNNKIQLHITTYIKKWRWRLWIDFLCMLAKLARLLVVDS